MDGLEQVKLMEVPGARPQCWIPREATDTLPSLLGAVLYPKVVDDAQVNSLVLESCVSRLAFITSLLPRFSQKCLLVLTVLGACCGDYSTC